MSPHLILFRDSAAPEHADVPPRVLFGTPATRYRVYAEAENGRLSAGEWTATPGTWRVAYDEWEFCQVVAGRAELREDGRAPVVVGPGDAFVIASGFTGEWAVEQTLTKNFVILDPPA